MGCTIQLTAEELRDARDFWRSITGSDLLAELREMARTQRDVRESAIIHRRPGAAAAAQSPGPAH